MPFSPYAMRTADKLHGSNGGRYERRRKLESNTYKTISNSYILLKKN